MIMTRATTALIANTICTLAAHFTLKQFTIISNTVKTKQYVRVSMHRYQFYLERWRWKQQKMVSLGNHWRIHGGASVASPPPGWFNFFYFYAVFGENWINNRLAPQPLELAPPPPEHPLLVTDFEDLCVRHYHHILFSIMPMVTVWITDRMVDESIFFPLFLWIHLIIVPITDTDYKKSVTCKQTLTTSFVSGICIGDKQAFSCPALKLKIAQLNVIIPNSNYFLSF